MATINLIYASDMNGCIGKDNALPFKIKGDMQFFKTMTMGGVVVMGRKTFESIGKPLAGRKNIVISRNPTPQLMKYQLDGRITIFNKIDIELVAHLKSLPESVWVIGGAEIYNQFLLYSEIIWQTKAHAIINGNVFFNFDESNYNETPHKLGFKSVDNEFGYTIRKFVKC